jgi:hypothetical protein
MGERGGRLAIFHIRLILPESQSSQGRVQRQTKEDRHRVRAGCASRCKLASRTLRYGEWIIASGVNGLGVYPAILEEVASAQQRPEP